MAADSFTTDQKYDSIESPLKKSGINSGVLIAESYPQAKITNAVTTDKSPNWQPELATTAAVTAAAALFIASKGKIKLPSILHAEEAGMTKLVGGIRVKLANSQSGTIEKIVFKNGRVAEPRYAGWEEYTPKGFFGNKKADLKYVNGDYSVNKHDMLEFKDRNFIHSFYADGTMGKRSHTDMFVSHGVSFDYMKEMYSTYLKIDPALREHVVASKAQFHFGQKLPDMFPFLQKMKPTGDARTNFYQARGCNFNHISAMTEGSGKGTFLHEFGHEVDEVLGISKSTEFITAHRQDVANNIAPLSEAKQLNINYFVQAKKFSESAGELRGRQETVAELFKAINNGGDEWEMSRLFPASKQHLEQRLAAFRGPAAVGH
jgi:hypothetical protein